MADQRKSAIATAQTGDLLGVSEWVTITQQMIDSFSRATLDDDPMHTDPVWAAEKGPFGKTVSYGFLTMSLLTHLMHDAMQEGPACEPEQTGYFLNFGFDRLRLVAPVPVDSRVRGEFRLATRSRDEAGRIRLGVDVVIEIEGAGRPALSALWVVVWVPPEQA
ncbi:hypothetical protein FJQ54_08485 [Sandaracinobacter neustonicus]|uniref:MaoC-like domain-containing protein n=1 Tax=Sandaracinobacter neustonicus TaxID=1715348 RepID=A0A501XM68_9SPHN|nr:MaoC/PaaZ C-terminal domain-containing protein [Sandaracinobacter neustonicus]TPE61373.1 hypothetical protein FJQ54_08485 [Sandaracinobacter neustonicus]